jgi:pyruvate ferredoxin oxidoreductase delta subunit
MAERALYCWEDLNLGMAITKPGNAREMKTGDWKTLMPILDEKKCIKCGLCAVYCPEFCVRPDKSGYFRADLNYCKGCGICAHECPKEALSMVREEK